MGKNSTVTSVRERLIVGISGASGVAYGIRLLEALAELGVESHLVISKAGQLTIGYETSLTPKAVASKADFSYPVGDIAAPIASGSFRTKGMIVAPCSVRTMSEIATGVTTTLLTRAADVALKERRTLVLMVRETPLHLGHLRTMAALAEMGAVLLPPVPAFYTAPRTLEDLVDHTVARALDAFGYDWPKAKRWGEGSAGAFSGEVCSGSPQKMRPKSSTRSKKA
ncbi:MAG TPA: UbiX family flavin prenyltransferase [Rhizomicrobium sp.]